MSDINLSNATLLNISQYAGCSIELELLHYEDDDITERLLEGDFKGLISKDENGEHPVIVFNPTVEGNKLTISMSEINTKIPPRTYFLGIRNTDKYLAYIGTFEILPNPAKSIT